MTSTSSHTTPQCCLEPQPRMTLGMMPADVMYLILGFLSPVTHLALAMTSKAFLTNLGFYKDLDTENKRQLLLLLEKDDPNKPVCFGCNRLARLDNQGPVTGWLNRSHYRCGGKVELARLRHWTLFDNDSGTETIKYTKDSWMAAKDGPEILFTDAHLVMNRHLYGEAYGLPIEILERSYTFERFLPSYKSSCMTFDHFPLERHPPGALRRLRHKPNDQATSTTNESSRESLKQEKTYSRRVRELRPVGPTPDEAVPWQYSHRYSAKIVDDELYISRSHHVVGPPKYKGDIAIVVSNIRLPFCVHLVGDPIHAYGSSHTWRNSPLGTTEQWFVEPPKPAKQPSFKKGRGPSFSRCCRRETKINGWSPTIASRRRSCKFCYTDYDVLLSMKNDCFHMEVKTYHRLGACRSPDDAIWTCLATQHDDVAGLIREDPCEIESLGQARAQWYKDGTVDESADWNVWDTWKPEKRHPDFVHSPEYYALGFHLIRHPGPFVLVNP